ncbi:YhcG N-terminal domain-containing protein [Flavobacterium branchiophilum]|nr:DUF1016 N-terminal domain-containing protein [Flavobacterium branchiophilum]
MEAATNISIDFILQLKQQILKIRFIVAKIANAESLKLYYTIGKQLEIQAKNEDWGSKVLETISQKLQQELPGLRGFSGSNLKKKIRHLFKEISQELSICINFSFKTKYLWN